MSASTTQTPIRVVVFLQEPHSLERFKYFFILQKFTKINLLNSFVYSLWQKYIPLKGKNRFIPSLPRLRCVSVLGQQVRPLGPYSKRLVLRLQSQFYNGQINIRLIRCIYTSISFQFLNTSCMTMLRIFKKTGKLLTLLNISIFVYIFSVGA